MNNYVTLQELGMTVDVLLRKTYRWELHSDGNFIAFMRNGGPDSEEQLCVVTDDSLAVLHPGLPVSMRAASCYNAAYEDGPQLSGIHVVKTLKYLNNEMLTFTCTLGAKTHMYDVYYLDYSTTSNSVLVVRGTLARIETIEYGGSTVDFVSEVFTTEKMVCPAFLEQNYPGWNTRWEFCKAVNMTVKDYMSYVFTNSPVLTTASSLSDLSFD